MSKIAGGFWDAEADKSSLGERMIALGLEGIVIFGSAP